MSGYPKSGRVSSTLPHEWCSCNKKVFREGLKEAEVCKLSQKDILCQIPGYQPKVSTKVLNLRFLEINSLKLLLSVFMPDRRL